MRNVICYDTGYGYKGDKKQELNLQEKKYKLKLIPLNSFNADWKREFETLDEFFTYVHSKGYENPEYIKELAKRKLTDGKYILYDTSLGRLVNEDVEVPMTEYTSF